jgi:hypothetical protein
MKSIIHPILILISFLFFFQALQGKGVHGLYSKQEPKSKMVTLTYTLIIDQDETAKIEFLFSSDDGATYSPCVSITGDIGDAVTTGRKTAIWDAGADWDLREKVLVLGGSVSGFSNHSGLISTPRNAMSVGEEVSTGGGHMVGFRAIRVQY